MVEWNIHTYEFRITTTATNICSSISQRRRDVRLFLFRFNRQNRNNIQGTLKRRRARHSREEKKLYTAHRDVKGQK